VSLSWRDELGVVLHAQRLVLARASGGWRPRLKRKEIIALEPAAPGMPAWQPALEALAGEVERGAFAGADVSVVLSSGLVRYAVVPHSGALAGEQEQLAFARHCFARIYGAEADAWALRLSDAQPRKPRLACAVDQALIEALDRVLAPLGARYRSLQPHLMASFNRWRARLGERPGWFVVAEPGLLCLALLRRGQWLSVRTVKAGPDWPGELPGVLTREECLVDSPEACDEVLLFAPDDPEPVIAQPGKWRISRLLPTLLPGMAAGVDAPFSVALGL
jgi:hypothetical protein